MMNTAHGKTRSLSDSSSDEDCSSSCNFKPPLKKKTAQYYIEENLLAKNVVNKHSNEQNNMPSPSVTKKHGFLSRSSTSDQYTEFSDKDSPIAPSIHQVFIKPKCEADPIINQKAKDMMEKMGWAKGTGLGKQAQGLIQPIELSKQRGRRGLGLQIKGFEVEDLEWDSSGEIVEVEEVVSWLPSHNMSAPTGSEMRDWLVEGNKKLSIQDEITFCEQETLMQVLQCKSIFDVLEEEELRKARTRSNPFETIRGAFFLNRAAMKMANLDAVFEFMFTSPKNEDGTSFLSLNETLYFADVCAGPGGFSEYVLWRKKWEAKGFGFTLKGANDFKLEDFHAAPCECFEPYYGLRGVDGDGDVYNPENIREFKRFVLSQTDDRGVHFMMADGGFSVEGQENLQEILSKRLYLCQFLVALAIIREGGHFVCKVFDLFTPFSAGLVYLMYRSFKQVCIHKPNTSRPANSERYIICKWKRNDTSAIEAYLFEVNCRFHQLSRNECQTDVIQIVPQQLMTDNRDFYYYLSSSNNALGMRQVVNLVKIAAFCKDVTLREDRQSELKKQSLDFWKIPDKARTAPLRMSPSDKAKELTSSQLSLFDEPAKSLTDVAMLHNTVKSIYDWRCVVLGLEAESPMQTFFLGLGRNNVFRWDPSKSRWHKLTENLELVRDTLIYGEIVTELRGEGRSQKRSYALHIIDALVLGGVDVSQLHLKERYDKIHQYSRAINKTSRTDLVTVRVKEQFKLEDVDQIFNRLVPRIIKNMGCQDRLVLCLGEDDQRAFLPSGLLLYKATKSPWMLALSKNSGRKYWFNIMTRVSLYDCPKESIACTYECHKTRIVWWWKTGFHESNRLLASDSVTKTEMISFLHTMLGK